MTKALLVGYGKLIYIAKRCYFYRFRRVTSTPSGRAEDVPHWGLGAFRGLSLVVGGGMCRWMTSLV